MIRTGPAAALLALALAAPLGAQQAGNPIRPRTTYEDLQMFSQVLNQIRVNHPDSIDTHALFMAAIEGMVSAVDPHSYVIAATRLSPEKERELRAGKLHPVPVNFVLVEGSHVVASVAPGSAAAREDILPGDELVAVEGAPVAAKSAEELEIGLAGPRGSSVKLTLERRRIDGSLARLERTVRRERSEDEETPVPTAFLMDGGTGYVRITTFASARAAEDLHAALERLEKQGMQRLVLDLRDNGGGLVNEAVRVAGEFLPSGTLVHTIEGRKKEVSETYKVGRSFFRSERRYPIVLLTNEGTASASELVAGALQDHDRARVVGRPSFGKALVMQGFPLADGSIAVLVTGHGKTPCGRVIQRQYRNLSRRQYYRMAEAERDTVGRPSCKTAGGRTVYGGGGIYPDVVLPRRTPAPLWLARVREENLPLKWTGGYVSASGAALTSADALAASRALPAAALAEFRAFATQQGVQIPAGAEADALLQRTLVLAVARVKWGNQGYYRVAAALDPEVDEAAREAARGGSAAP